MVERPSHQPVAGVEGGEKASADAWIQQSAQPLEKTRCVRPGHIVQVAGYQSDSTTLFDLLRDHQQLRIALVHVLPRQRRLRMHGVELYLLAGSEPNGRAH